MQSIGYTFGETDLNRTLTGRGRVSYAIFRFIFMLAVHMYYYGSVVLFDGLLVVVCMFFRLYLFLAHLSL